MNQGEIAISPINTNYWTTKCVLDNGGISIKEKLIVLLFILYVLCLLSFGQADAKDINILDHTMASKVDESTNNVIMRTDNFDVTDSKAYSWLSLGNVGAGLVKWIWYSPDGNQFYTGSVDIPMPTDGAYWSSYNIWYYIDIAGSDAVNMPGNWHVDVYLDGNKILTERFSIQGTQGSQQTSVKDLFDKGQELFFEHKYDDALQAFDDVIKIDPKNAAAWQNKGEILSAQHKYDEATTAFDQAIYLNPQDADTWNSKGAVLNAQGKYDEAIQAYDQAINIDPQNAMPWNNKGVVLKKQGKYEEAIQAFDQAIKIDPKSGLYWSNKGDTLDKMGRTAEANEAYQKAKELGI